MNNDELTNRLFDIDGRVSHLEAAVKQFATTTDLGQAVTRVELAHHETALALKVLAEKFESFSASYRAWLKDRAHIEEEERKEKMEMMRAEHQAKVAAVEKESAAKVSAIEQKTWPELVTRWGKVIAVITGLITILTALAGLILWIAKTAN